MRGKLRKAMEAMEGSAKLEETRKSHGKLDEDRRGFVGFVGFAMFAGFACWCMCLFCFISNSHS